MDAGLEGQTGGWFRGGWMQGCIKFDFADLVERHWGDGRSKKKAPEINSCLWIRDPATLLGGEASAPCGGLRREGPGLGTFRRAHFLCLSSLTVLMEKWPFVKQASSSVINVLRKSIHPFTERFLLLWVVRIVFTELLSRLNVACH